MSECNEVLTYRKSVPSEVIEVGDIIMLDPNTSCITRAVAEHRYDFALNSKLVIGVCVWSSNSGPLPVIIDGGTAEDEDKKEITGGLSDSIQTIIIEGGEGHQFNREIIKIAYTDRQLVNICGYVNIGDKLCISETPGKAKSKDFLDGEYYYSRTIGKVTQFTNNRNQVIALLDIE